MQRSTTKTTFKFSIFNIIIMTITFLRLKQIYEEPRCEYLLAAKMLLLRVLPDAHARSGVDVQAADYLHQRLYQDEGSRSAQKSDFPEHDMERREANGA